MENKDCPCTRTKCERHGKCDECRAHHHSMTGRKSLTRCEKLEAKARKKSHEAHRKG